MIFAKSLLLILYVICGVIASHAQPPVVPTSGSSSTADAEEHHTNDPLPPEFLNAPNGNGTNGRVAMNFQDIEIAVLARFISEITSKNFVIDEKVRGKITILSPTKVTPEEAYTVFQSALQVKGYTTVPSGDVIKIVPSREARQAGIPTLTNGALAEVGDEFITRLVPLRHVTAAEMAPIVQPLVSSDGLVIPYPPTNALILTDSATNVRQLLAMLKTLDEQGYQRVTEIIPLKHAVAADLAKKIEDIMKEQPASDPLAGQPRVRGSVTTVNIPSNISSPISNGFSRGVRVLPDERTNALIVMGGALELKTVRHLVAGLDVPLPPGISKINVYPLKHANAEEMLAVLADLIGVGSGNMGSRPARNPRRERRSRSDDGSRSSSDRFRSTMGERSPSLAASQSAQPQTPIGGVVGKTAEFNSEVQITADPATNSLIISAAPQDFETLKKVIEQLDIRRRQVYVEAIILEVSVDRIRELGIELQGGFSIDGQGVGLGRVNLRDLNAAVFNPASLSGLLLAAASDRMITLPDGRRVPAKVALLRAAQDDNDINVLSSPTILTTDNEEAEILVGQNVPFVSSRATDATELDNLFATIERENVGITLRLTPQISEGESVRLDIYEEVSALVPTIVGDPNLVGPTTSIRSASTTVVVKDGQTVVIGGLISDNTLRERNTVPYLGDIPVLGNLFRSDANTTNKINLLIYLTPHIVRDDTEIANRSVEERDRFRDFLQEHNVPPQWQEQLDRPSFEMSPDPESGGVLLPAVEDNPVLLPSQ